MLRIVDILTHMSNYVCWKVKFKQLSKIRLISSIRYAIVCFVMRGKKLRISSEGEAGEEMIGLDKTIISSSASFFSSKFAIFLSLIKNYIFHNEYFKLTLFSTIVYILHFITHVIKYCEFWAKERSGRRNNSYLQTSRFLSRFVFARNPQLFTTK